MAVNLPTGFARTTNNPIDQLYLSNTLAPYATVAAANTAILVGIRYLGLFVNISNGSGGSLLYWYKDGTADGNLVAFSSGGSGTVTSVGVSMPSAFSVASSPITTSGTIAITGAGLASQYIRGDGALANFPTSTGGGSSVSYYLNGSVNQGTILGNVYEQMSRTAIFGSGTDFNINTNGYIAQFITDIGDPDAIEIPSGNWNLEFYFSASSSGGAPKFYVELYKYDGAAFTLIASNSATPESITGGTSIDLYFTSVGVPLTTLTITDRLAIRVYVLNSGRTITLHTEDSYLCQIITTFSTGLTALNGLTDQVQYLGTGVTGSDFNISSVGDTHTFNLPDASALNTGKLTSTDWALFNGKQNALNITNLTDVGTDGISITNGTGSVIGSSAVTIAQQVADATHNGYLSSGDWVNFNGKGTVTSVGGTSPIVSSGGTTPSISIPQANATTNGYLSSGDWTSFTNKGNGTVTSVGTGTGLTGGTITGSGTISFSTAAVGTWAATPSSANLASAMTDETGTGSLVFGTSPTITTSLTVNGKTISGYNTTPLQGSIQDGVTSILGDLKAWTTEYYQGDVLYSEVSAATITFGQLCYRTNTGEWNLADATTNAAASYYMLGICLKTTTGTGQATSILTKGFVETTYAAENKIGEPQYMSTTAGSMTKTAPTSSGNVVRIIGNTFWTTVVNTNGKYILNFNPDNTWIELT